MTTPNGNKRCVAELDATAQAALAELREALGEQIGDNSIAGAIRFAVIQASRQMHATTKSGLRVV
jgi:hypothetical protein